MGLFDFMKKKKQEDTGCGCGNGGGCCSSTDTVKEESISTCGCCNSGTKSEKQEVSSPFKVLGSGCTKCNDLEKSTIDALSELGLDTTVDHVTNFSQIASYGVMTTPALVIDNKVVSMGKVLKKDEVIELIKKTRNL